MDILVIVGFILAFLNPVIGGVLVGYIVWLSRPDTGFQIIVLSFFMLSLYGIAYIVWSQKKIKKLENALSLKERE
jgi:cbb3-type cytochrome oxidase subunit 3